MTLLCQAYPPAPYPLPLGGPPPPHKKRPPKFFHPSILPPAPPPSKTRATFQRRTGGTERRHGPSGPWYGGQKRHCGKTAPQALQATIAPCPRVLPPPALKTSPRAANAPTAPRAIWGAPSSGRDRRALGFVSVTTPPLGGVTHSTQYADNTSIFNNLACVTPMCHDVSRLKFLAYKLAKFFYSNHLRVYHAHDTLC
jgi:hypothetical protein